MIGRDCVKWPRANWPTRIAVTAGLVLVPYRIVDAPGRRCQGQAHTKCRLIESAVTDQGVRRL